MKILGMVMIVAFSSCLGLMVTQNKKRQISFIDDLIYIGNYISLLLGSTVPDTNEIMYALTNDKRLSDFNFDLENFTSPLNAGDNQRIVALLSSVGMYDVDTQLMMLKEFTGYFGMLKKEYQDNYNRCYKLYIVFGIFTGLLISVLLI
ncbi:MAG: stage III sporulation protein AB [Clostridium sp.]|nr:stage III sporulation protein AB [Clostridium sp.]